MKKTNELILRLIRAAFLSIVFAFIIMLLYSFILPPDYLSITDFLETEEWVGAIAGLALFAILAIPEKQRILKITLTTLLSSYLFLVAGRMVEGFNITTALLIFIPALFIGLLLTKK